MVMLTTILAILYMPTFILTETPVPAPEHLETLETEVWILYTPG